MIKIPFTHRVAFVAIIVSVFITLGFIALVIFHNYPYSMDEYRYLYQAKIFLTGHLSLSADEKLARLFETNLVFSHGHLFSKYPPGFSLMLLFGLKLGNPIPCFLLEP